MSNHCVKRAIILAAGKGERLRPVTLSTPKPLVKVNGVRMIDSIVNALHTNGIYEIYVVVGYLKEQYTQWAQQYNGITLIENPWYNECNNISSLYVAREHLENAIILEGDQVIHNPGILHPDFERSCYNCVWTNNHTKEWFLTTENDIVTSCNRTGGCNGWQLYGISRWTKDDAKKLKMYLEEEFIQKKNGSIFWDDIALFCHSDAFQLGVYPVNHTDLLEIDSFEELIVLDPSYRQLTSAEVKK